MDPSTLAWIALLMAVAAALYSSVGHGGASAYLAIMALFAVAPETGDLSFTGKYTPVGNPSQIAFLDLSARPEGNPAPPPS